MKTMTSAPSRQRGVTVTGWILIIVTVVIFGTAAATLAPIYIEHNTVSGIIKSVMNDPKIGLKSENEIRADLGKRFGINNVKAISQDDVGIIKDGGRLELQVDYEVRHNFFKNVDFVVYFKEDFEQNIR